MGCFTTTSRHYYEWVVLLRTTSRHYYEWVVLLRTTSRHYYEWVVLLRYHDITFLLRMVCLLHVLLHHVTLLQRSVVLLVHYVFTTNDLFAYTCFTTVTCTLHFYYNYHFCAMFWLLLVLGISSKFRKPLGIKKGVRLYFVFPRIHRSWLVNLF